jgi:NAD(P)-dependent dehydrogenase (short-subunit alcohol dehydrogenase family)
MPSAQSRVVFLTGAAGGIGLAMTDALLAAGHRVAAVDRDAKALERPGSPTPRIAYISSSPILPMLRAARAPSLRRVRILAQSKPSSTMPASA